MKSIKELFAQDVDFNLSDVAFDAAFYALLTTIALVGATLSAFAAGNVIFGIVGIVAAVLTLIGGAKWAKVIYFIIRDKSNIRMLLGKKSAEEVDKAL